MNSSVFSDFLNSARDVEERTASGKLFQTDVAAAEKPLPIGANVRAPAPAAAAAAAAAVVRRTPVVAYSERPGPWSLTLVPGCDKLRRPSAPTACPPESAYANRHDDVRPTSSRAGRSEFFEATGSGPQLEKNSPRSRSDRTH